jgi:Icc-related predicted phosphoesterase
MRITAISDIHGDLIQIKPTDLLIIAGDWSPLEIQRNPFFMREWMNDCLLEWFKEIHADKIIFIAGNHDFVCDPNYINMGFTELQFLLSFEKDFLQPLLRKHNLTNKVKYLCNSLTVYKGYRIYGFPNVEGCRGWAFSQAEIRQSFKLIKKCDILITHQPPLYNRIGRTVVNKQDCEFGSYQLLDVIQRKRPQYLFCGHIHEGDHSKTVYNHPEGGFTEMYNCSIKDEEYNVFFKPQVVDIPNRTGENNA